MATQSAPAHSPEAEPSMLSPLYADDVHLMHHTQNPHAASRDYYFCTPDKPPPPIRQAHRPQRPPCNLITLPARCHSLHGTCGDDIETSGTSEQKHTKLHFRGIVHYISPAPEPGAGPRRSFLMQSLSMYTHTAVRVPPTMSNTSSSSPSPGGRDHYRRFS